MTGRRIAQLDADNFEETLRDALGTLEEDRLVCVPTETVYGIGGRGDRPRAVERLAALKGKRDGPFTLHVGSAEDAFRLGHVTPVAQRLARGYWPGPLTLVLDATPAGADWAADDGTVGFRVVAHPFTRELCARSPAPLFLSSANVSGHPPPTSATDVTAVVGNLAELTVDDGPTAVGAPSTVVRTLRGGPIEILREGAIPETRVLTRAATLILFVCSGNTCRSPMAEVLARAKWANELGVTPADLVRHGILVASAGVGAFPGLPASDNAVLVATELDLDLSEHASRPLEPALLARAQRTFCMGEHHRRAADALLEAAGGPFDEDASPPELLGGPEGVTDPFGGDVETYRTTCERIRASLPSLEEVLG